VDLNKLSLGDRIVAGAGILLFIDLLFLPWHRVSVGTSVFKVTVTRSGVESPNAFWGWLALLLTVAIVAVLLVRRLTTAKLPDLPIPWNQATFFATIAVEALLVIKLVAETDFLGFGAWIALVLAAAMIYGGFLVFQQSEASPPEATPPPGTAPMG
jgi:hypothetical protein